MIVAEQNPVLTRLSSHEADGVSRADLYRDSFHAIPLVTFLTDQRAVILDASRTAVTFLNVTPAAIFMKPLLHFVARRETRAFRELVRDMAFDQVGPVVAKLRPRHGVPCAMSMTAMRVGARGAFIWVAIPEKPAPVG